jgi:hypothetical protein
MNHAALSKNRISVRRVGAIVIAVVALTLLMRTIVAYFAGHGP